MTCFRAKTKDLVRRIIVVSYLYYEQELDVNPIIRKTTKVAIGIIFNIQGRSVVQRMKACTNEVISAPNT